MWNESSSNNSAINVIFWVNFCIRPYTQVEFWTFKCTTMKYLLRWKGKMPLSCKNTALIFEYIEVTSICFSEINEIKCTVNHFWSFKWCGSGNTSNNTSFYTFLARKHLTLNWILTESEMEDNSTSSAIGWPSSSNYNEISFTERHYVYWSIISMCNNAKISAQQRFVVICLAQSTHLLDIA